MKKVTHLLLMISCSLYAMHEEYAPQPIHEYEVPEFEEEGTPKDEEQLKQEQADYQKKQAELARQQSASKAMQGTMSSGGQQNVQEEQPSITQPQQEIESTDQFQKVQQTYRPINEPSNIPARTMPPTQEYHNKPEISDVKTVVAQGIKEMDSLVDDFNNIIKSIAQGTNSQARVEQENLATTQAAQKVDDMINEQAEQIKVSDQKSFFEQLFTWLSKNSEKLFNAWRKLNEDALSSLRKTIKNLKDTISKGDRTETQVSNLQDELKNVQNDEQRKAAEQKIADETFIRDYKPKLTNTNIKKMADNLDQAKNQLSMMQKFTKLTKQEDLLQARGKVASVIGDLVSNRKGLRSNMDYLAYKDETGSDDYNDLNYYSLTSKDLLSSYQDLQQHLNDEIVNQFEAKAQNISNQISKAAGNQTKLVNLSTQIAQLGADGAFILESKSYDYLIGDWQKSIKAKLKEDSDIYSKYRKVIIDGAGNHVDETAANILDHLYDILYQYSGIKVNENSSYEQFSKAGNGITKWRGQNPTDSDADVLRELEMYTHAPYVELYKAYKKGVDTFNSLIFDEASRNKIEDLNINLNEQMNRAHGFA